MPDQDGPTVSLDSCRHRVRGWQGRRSGVEASTLGLEDEHPVGIAARVARGRRELAFARWRKRRARLDSVRPGCGVVPRGRDGAAERRQADGQCMGTGPEGIPADRAPCATGRGGRRRGHPGRRRGWRSVVQVGIARAQEVAVGTGVGLGQLGTPAPAVVAAQRSQAAERATSWPRRAVSARNQSTQDLPGGVGVVEEGPALPVDQVATVRSKGHRPWACASRCPTRR